MFRSRCLRQPRSALDVGEFGFAGVGRVRVGAEPAEVTIECGFDCLLAVRLATVSGASKAPR